MHKALLETKGRKMGTSLLQLSETHSVNKTNIIIFIIIFMCFLFSGCQRAKDPEHKKEINVQREEIKQSVPAETKPDFQSKQGEKQTAPTEVKKTQEEEKKEKPVEVKKALLTEKEQKEFEMLKKKWLMPNFKEEDALEALRILVKADLDPANLRWYTAHPDYEPGDDICDMLRLSSRTKKAEAFELTLKILKEDRGYVTVCAAKEIKNFNNKKAIPYLRKYLRHTSSNEQLTIMLRLEAAGSLLALGDADTALPALEELTKEGNTYAIPYLFKSGWGKPWKFWDERGLEIIKKALNYPKNKIRAEAALFLSQIGIEKQKAEEVALSIVENLKDKTAKDYGLPIDKVATRLTPEGDRFYDDNVACDYAMAALSNMKSEKIVSTLKIIREKNTEWWNVCRKRPADEALKRILEKRDGGTR